MNALLPDPSAFPASNRPTRRRPVADWPWPIALGMFTLFGLFSALLGQHGIWLALSWCSLSIPLIVTVLCLLRAWCALSVKGGRS